MRRYYTRVCNFYYGKESKKLIIKKKTLPLNEIQKINYEQKKKKTKKKIFIKDVKKLSKSIQKQIIFDLKKITLKNKNFSNLNFQKLPNIMRVLNLTPDSLSDGGKINKTSKSIKHA